MSGAGSVLCSRSEAAETVLHRNEEDSKYREGVKG